MKRMKNGTVGMEFSAATKGKGYTMRANISADCIRALKRSDGLVLNSIHALFFVIPHVDHLAGSVIDNLVVMLRQFADP